MTPEPVTYDPATSGHAVVGWSPYAGMRLPWRVAGTWLRGKQVFDGTALLAAPGAGRFVGPQGTLPL